jgi:UTP--glucose-1-phosphate uridylyltransferase
MTQIKTAVIPVGGFGTRFLPASKSIPKEMFPVGNKPVVYHVVSEVLAAGITNILFVVSQQKQSLESFFSRDEMMENYYSSHGKNQQALELKQIAEMAHFSYIYTEPPSGNGGALRAVENLVGNDPFVLVWGDEFFINKGKINRIQQCINVFLKHKTPVVSILKMPKRRLSTYGIAAISKNRVQPDVYKISKIVEKPKGNAPSNYAVLGTYVLTKDIFNAMKKTKVGTDGELWLTDLINEMSKKTGLLGKVIKDAYYLDCGNPHDYVLSQIEYVFANSEVDPHFKKHLAKLSARYCKSCE